MTRRMAVLAQFDPEGGVPAHVRLHLEGLRPHVDRLILVSNSPIDPASLSAAETICDRVLQRANIGWDFAGWRDVFASEDLTPYDWVILTNSSVIGPLYPIEPVLRSMEAQKPDVWGMVMSRNKGRHLQSYFLSASSRVLASKAWQSFWASVHDFDDKRQVIRDYEVGFSRAMMAADFKLVGFSKTLPSNSTIVSAPS